MLNESVKWLDSIFIILFLRVWQKEIRLDILKNLKENEVAIIENYLKKNEQIII